jgi:enterochelin esterase-like enzyme
MITPPLRALVASAIAGAALPCVAAVAPVAIFSPSNGRDLTFYVYTPPGYATNASQTYPVVYSLHGIGGTPLQRANTYAPTLDQRTAAGLLAPMIWVFPDGQLDSFYGDAFDGHSQVYSHIIGEIIPYVDDNYRTIPYREGRAMEGFSMGGFGAAMYAAKHPELFSAVLEYGGALSTWQSLVQFNNAVAVDMYDGVEANWLAYSLWDVTTANAPAIDALVNYKMIVGDADMQLQSNFRFRDHLLSLGIDPQFEVVPGVPHSGGAYLNEGTGLEFLDQHFATPYEFTGDFNRDGAVDGSDLLLWQQQLGSASGNQADGNHDGHVDRLDLIIWRGDFGRTVVQASSLPIPEPSTAVIGVMAALLIASAGRAGAAARFSV